MRFIIYFILFYIIIRIVRRLIFGPPPKRRVYVNWGRTGGFDPRANPHQNNQTSHPEDDTPRVGNLTNRSKNLGAIQDADFEEIKDSK